MIYDPNDKVRIKENTFVRCDIDNRIIVSRNRILTVKYGTRNECGKRAYAFEEISTTILEEDILTLIKEESENPETINSRFDIIDIPQKPTKWNKLKKRLIKAFKDFDNKLQPH